MDQRDHIEADRIVPDRTSNVSRIALAIATGIAVLVFGGGVAAGFLGSSATSRAGSVKVSVAWGPYSAMITGTGRLDSLVTLVDGNPIRFDDLDARCFEVVGAVTTLWVADAAGAGTRLDRPGDAALAEDASIEPSVRPCAGETAPASPAP